MCNDFHVVGNAPDYEDYEHNGCELCEMNQLTWLGSLNGPTLPF